MKKLNLGCGRDYHPDMINVDNWRDYKADIYCDLNNPWPWHNNEIDEIHAHHILEHMDSIEHFFLEAWGVLTDGGLLRITVPWWSGHWALGDPTHKHLFNDQSFLIWSDWADQYKHINYGHAYRKIRDSYQFDTGYNSNPFLKESGFSHILAYQIDLEKRP